MTHSLYRVLRNYDLEVACSGLHVPLGALTTREDMIFRSFGQRLSDKRLRRAIRYGELSAVVSDPCGVPREELRLVLGSNLYYETWVSRAQYLDERIRSHPSRPLCIVSSRTR